MEKISSIEEIRSLAIAGGVKEKRLDNDVRPTYLPEAGTFDGWEVAQPNSTMAHLRMVCDDGNSISIGTLKASAFFGTKEDAKFRKVDRKDSPMVGKFALIGTTVINPNLGGKIPEVVARLIGKKFRAVKVEAYTLDYGDGKGYATEVKAKENLINKAYYKVEIE